jgi:predicted NUDIX family NTP pyrophosphohydrolase
MTKQSAGLLLFKRKAGELSVLLVHPGGPFWRNKDIGAWSIPKGEFEDREEPLSAAVREVEEEIGLKIDGDFISLGQIQQPSRKIVHAWGHECDFDPSKLKSNVFEIEWPPKSGKTAKFPEVDRAGWFTIEQARDKILKGQAPFLDRLVTALEASRA